MLDEVHTLNDETPKIRTNGRAGVDPGLIFNLDSKLASSSISDAELSTEDGGAHNDEVATHTVWRGSPPPHSHAHEDASCDKCAPPHDHEHEHAHTDASPITRAILEAALKPLAKDVVYRVKGFLRLADESHGGVHILNFAFGRFDLTPAASSSVLPDDSDVRLTVMGHPGEVKRYATRFAAALGAQLW